MFGSKKSSDDTLYCSFCGKSQHEVRKLVAGSDVFICDECIELCSDIVRQEHQADAAITRGGFSTPLEAAHLLSESVAGHLRAKYVLSLAATERMAEITKKEEGGLRKGLLPRVLLIGPIGCGKRLLAQSVARALGAPFVVANDGDLDGVSVDSAWEQLAVALLTETQFVHEKAKWGVVYLELDDELPDGLLEFCTHPSVTISKEGPIQAGEPRPTFDLSCILLIVGSPLFGLPSTSGPIRRDQIAKIETQLDGPACCRLAEELRNVTREALAGHGLPSQFLEVFPYVAAMRDLYDGTSEEDLGA